MKVVGFLPIILVTIDANILFSALLRKGPTRKIWFSPELELYAPLLLLTEFKKYGEFLQKKFVGSKKEFELLSRAVLSQAYLVQDKELEPYLPAAASLLKDPKDWLYMACALKENTFIWSNDKGFKKQKRVKAKTTSEMMEEIGLL